MPPLPRFLSASLRLGAILAVAQAATAAEPLVWKWAEGDTSRYQLTQEMRMSMNAGPAGKVETSSRNVTVMRWTAESVTDQGAATLDQATERVVMKTEGPAGQGFTYDSQDGEPPAGMAALIAPAFEAMCEHPFKVTMAPTGKINDVVLTDELAEAFDKLPGGAVSTEMLTQMVQQGSLEFPEKPLEVGDQWSNSYEVNTPPVGGMRITLACTYEGPRTVEGRELEVIAAEMTMETAGPAPASGMELNIETKSSDVEFLFDRAAGRLVQSRLSQLIEMQINAGGQEIVNEINQTVSMRALAEGEEPALTDSEPAEEPATSLAE